MQVFLNDESEYVGGHLVYLLNGHRHGGQIALEANDCSPDIGHAGGVLRRVGRPVGGAVLHDSTVVHGVTRCSEGVRYSLFLIRNHDGASNCG
jgi:hypothetical protein